MLCIETSASLGSLQKFKGAAGEIKGALAFLQPLILSPASYNHISHTLHRSNLEHLSSVARYKKNKKFGILIILTKG